MMLKSVENIKCTAHVDVDSTSKFVLSPHRLCQDSEQGNRSVSGAGTEDEGYHGQSGEGEPETGGGGGCRCEDG